ncbi:hypothetical protein E2C01_044379 [Portunus trituberculatus]|uniref:Uncharacterized protein n=1 Tax=Portunus trituberculatus TaxID=210409 RepID=A0A5B7FRZ1_PORTR|nr:hypothetical protein [Portunus trituberculatus]
MRAIIFKTLWVHLESQPLSKKDRASLARNPSVLL